MEKRSRAAYMREYRRRKRDGLPTIRQQARATNHEACDAEIQRLRMQVQQLEAEVKHLHSVLPF